MLQIQIKTRIMSSDIAEHCELLWNSNIHFLTSNRDVELTNRLELVCYNHKDFVFHITYCVCSTCLFTVSFDISEHLSIRECYLCKTNIFNQFRMLKTLVRFLTNWPKKMKKFRILIYGVSTIILPLLSAALTDFLRGVDFSF